VWTKWSSTTLLSTDIVRVPEGATYGAGRDGKTVGTLPISWVRWNLNNERIWIERDGARLEPSPRRTAVSQPTPKPKPKQQRRARTLYDPWSRAMSMAPPDPKPVIRNRPCLVCRTRMVGSTGPGHRICDFCRREGNPFWG
jgi:hypothetical protein